MAIGSNNQYAAGPFKANDLIVNNQAMFSNPGMMALVAKEARKGTSGFFEIPNRERKEAPFLTAAKEKVNQDLGLSPAVQGGMKNFLGESETVEGAPKKWQSSPNAPATELAYITDAEKKLLLDANLHNSLDDGMPNQGPSGIISLDGMGVGDDDYDSNKDQNVAQEASSSYGSYISGLQQGEQRDEDRERREFGFQDTDYSLTGSADDTAAAIEAERIRAQETAKAEANRAAEERKQEQTLIEQLEEADAKRFEELSKKSDSDMTEEELSEYETLLDKI